jgi:uncharacterized protein YjbI with pentapeptide repeats
MVETGQDLDQSRFTRAVFSNEGVDLAGQDFYGAVSEGNYRPEGLGCVG